MNAVFDETVDTIGSLEFDCLVDVWQSDLVLELQTVNRELILKAAAVRALEQTSAESLMDWLADPQDRIGDLLMKHRDEAAASSAVARFPGNRWANR
jgi:hypothetical protein